MPQACLNLLLLCGVIRRGGNFTYSDWWREAGGQRDWLTRNCSIPARCERL